MKLFMPLSLLFVSLYLLVSSVLLLNTTVEKDKLKAELTDTQILLIETGENCIKKEIHMLSEVKTVLDNLNTTLQEK